MNKCQWVSTSNKKCSKNTTSKLCAFHANLLDGCILQGDVPCDIYEEIKFTPRSYKHLIHIMETNNNVGDYVDACVKGECIEEADISNSDFILMLSDDVKFYYESIRGERKAKDLRIIIRKCCPEKAKVKHKNKNYCTTCYNKLKNAPSIDLYNT